MNDEPEDAASPGLDEDARRERDIAVAEAAFGSWRDRDLDGEGCVERMRTGMRRADILDR